MANTQLSSNKLQLNYTFSSFVVFHALHISRQPLYDLFMTNINNSNDLSIILFNDTANIQQRTFTNCVHSQRLGQKHRCSQEALGGGRGNSPQESKIGRAPKAEGF